MNVIPNKGFLENQIFIKFSHKLSYKVLCFLVTKPLEKYFDLQRICSIILNSSVEVCPMSRLNKGRISGRHNSSWKSVYTNKIRMDNSINFSRLFELFRSEWWLISTHWQGVFFFVRRGDRLSAVVHELLAAKNFNSVELPSLKE